jgi:hypothetical protein
VRWTLGMTLRWKLIVCWSSCVVFFERRRGKLLLLPVPIGLPTLLVLDLAVVMTYAGVRALYNDRLRRAVQLAATVPVCRTIHRSPGPLLRGPRVILHRRPGARGPHRVAR